MGNIQVGGFGSFKYLNFKNYQSGGGLGQAAFLVDWIFSRGRIGLFGTKGFKNFAVMNRVNLGPSSFLETYARVVDQAGVNYLFGMWGNSYLEGNLGYLRRHEGSGRDRPGGAIKLVQPLSELVAFTAEVGLNETLLNLKDSGRVTFGLQFGNYIHPKDYTKVKSPVPMDVPRVRYEIGTRRVGNSAPIADAGPNQIGIAAGQVTLNGSGSYDPDGDPLTYQWTQVGGPSVSLSGANTATATFTAAANTTYNFRLTVKDPGGLQGTASTTVTTSAPPAAPLIVQFTATPNQIQPGQTSTLAWVVQGATTVSIQPGLGNVSATGSSTVTPTQTTTYTLTATGPGGTVNATTTVTVGTAGPGNPQIIRFEANPVTIQPGQQSTLSWTTTGATVVTISGVGTVTPNGNTSVSPAQTTTYTLTASSADGRSVSAPVTVTVATGQVPQIVTFVANPQNIDAGQSTKICWQVTGANSIAITPDIGSNLSANDCATVSPTLTTTYTLTAINANGQIQANTTVNVGQVRILSFTSDPIFSGKSGDPVTLTWKTENATSVVLVGNDVSPQTLPANGTFVIHPIANSTYTLTAYGPGSQTVSVTISVFVR
jgi:uncharacterized cupredoxin-like copper-binding protein